MANLFHPSFGSRPERIVGRKPIVEQFVSGLQREPGHRDRCSLILGQRGMGKTALLLELAEEANRLGFVCARVTAGEDMLEEIIESLQLGGSQHLCDKGTKVKGFTAGALGFSLGLTFSEEVQHNYGFRTKLSLLCDRLKENDHKVLLLIDEVQPNSDAMRSLASTYQHLAGEGKDIAIALAGLPASLSRILNDKVLTFLNRARKYDAGPLPFGDVMAYYSDAFAREGRNITSAQVERVTEAAQGFPYLLQLIGYYVIEFSKEGDTLSDSLLDSAIVASRKELERDVFLPTLSPLSQKDIEVLSSIARLGGIAVPVSSVLADLGIENNYFQQYRSRLLDTGIVASPREGLLDITVPYLAEHLAASGK